MKHTRGYKKLNRNSQPVSVVGADSQKSMTKKIGLQYPCTRLAHVSSLANVVILKITVLPLRGITIVYPLTL